MVKRTLRRHVKKVRSLHMLLYVSLLTFYISCIAQICFNLAEKDVE